LHGNFRNKPDLRKKPRRRVRHAAILRVDKNGALRPCWLSDISDGGARLMLQSDCEIPDRFVLVLTKTGKIHRHCRIVWRKGLILGVEFQH
jgi:PilZ domain